MGTPIPPEENRNCQGQFEHIWFPKKMHVREKEEKLYEPELGPKSGRRWRELLSLAGSILRRPPVVSCMLLLYLIGGVVIYLKYFKQLRLPVYQVELETSPERLRQELSRNGFTNNDYKSNAHSITYENVEEHLRIPTKAVLNNLVPDAVGYQAFDMEAIRSLRVPDSVTATGIADRYLAGMQEENMIVTRRVGHTTLSIYRNQGISKLLLHQALETTVSYHVSDRDHYPFVGPGAQVNFSFGNKGLLTKLYYAWRRLKRGPSVDVISEREAKRRINRDHPLGGELELRIVYWCPPFSGSTDPNVILPWYEYTRVQIRHVSGRIVRDSMSVGRILATDDPRYVPRVHLIVRITLGTEVIAQAIAKEGAGSYRFQWSGSLDSLTLLNSSSVRYHPVLPYGFTSGKQRETLRVTVIDRNGVATTDTVNVTTLARAQFGFAPGIRGNKEITYGCESPNEPGPFENERIGWQKAMLEYDGGREVFAHCGDDSWPGNYIRAQSFPIDSPWIKGCADQSGINTARFIFVNGDADPDNLFSRSPGGPISEYFSTKLTLTIMPRGTVVMPGVRGVKYYPIPYDGSWGQGYSKTGAFWLAGLLCNMLKPQDVDGMKAVDRWGPAFGGLHMLLGFASNAKHTDGQFPRDFVRLMLFRGNGHPRTIRTAWFNSAQNNDVGKPAAMGPLMDGDIGDVDDYYFGRGAQGPTIGRDKIKGWWCLVSD
ncbi:MAG: DUF6345 domain-containing protein [Bacteroidota bacterium]